MPAPDKFSWVEKPHLAAMAKPTDREELTWLRAQGIELIISLTESPLRRDWVNDAGLMAVHVPVPDLTAPTPEQLEHCLSVIRRAQEKKFGVAIHCAAGLGRTGTLLAVWYVAQGLDPATAIVKVREMRPGSIETPEQERAVYEFGKSVPPQNRKPPEPETKPKPNITPEGMKAASRKIDEAFENAARLAGSDHPHDEFFRRFINVITSGIDARAGAVWLQTPSGYLHLQSYDGIEHARIAKQKNGPERHNELLRQAFQTSRPMLVEPHGSTGFLFELFSGNPTDYYCLLVPIFQHKDTAGIIELWIEPRYDVQMQRTFLNYLVQMAGYATEFLKRNSIELPSLSKPSAPEKKSNFKYQHKKTGSLKIDQTLDAVERLTNSGAKPNEYYPELMNLVVESIDAAAGVVWTITPQQFLKLQFQLNIENVRLDKHKNGRETHNELLRQAYQSGRPMLLEPYGTSGILEGVPAGNPTEFCCALVPIPMLKENVGILELWIDPKHDVKMQRTFLNYLVQVGGYVGQFMRQTNYPNE